VISILELKRVYMEWRTRLQRVNAILNPRPWEETDWKQFGRCLVGLLQSHGATWSSENKTYWDLRWNLRDGGELICQAEAVDNQKISLVVAQSGGWVEEAQSYTWFWVEFDMMGEFLRDPYWVEGTWREALMTLLTPYQQQSGYYLAGSAPTPPSLMLGNTSSETSTRSEPEKRNEEAFVEAAHI
jgi:hypothetical protein